MKLVFCPACNDIISLRFREVRTCACGAVGGVNINTKYCIISSEAIPLELDDLSLGKALRYRPTADERGYTIEARTVSENDKTMVRLDRTGAVVVSPDLDTQHISTLRNLFLESIPYTLDLHRRTKDYVRATIQTPEHRKQTKERIAGTI